MKNDHQDDSSDIRYSKSRIRQRRGSVSSAYIPSLPSRTKPLPSKCIQMRIYFMLMHDALRRKILCWSWKKCTRNLAQSMALLFWSTFLVQEKERRSESAMKNYYDEPYLNSARLVLLYHVRLCSSEYIFHHRQCDNIHIQKEESRYSGEAGCIQQP